MLLADDGRGEDEGKDIGEWTCHFDLFPEGSAAESIISDQLVYDDLFEALVVVICGSLVVKDDPAVLSDSLIWTGNVAEEGPGLLVVV